MAVAANDNHIARCIVGPVPAASGLNTNTATADSTESASDGDSASYFGSAPAIEVVKAVSIDGGTTWLDANTPPGPSFSLRDRSPIPLHRDEHRECVALDLGLTDTDMGSFFQADLVTPCVIPASMVPAASFICYGTLTWAAGQHTDTATASGAFNATSVTDTDDAHYYGSVPPTVAKAFNPDTIAPGGVSQLTLTLGNPNTIAATLSADFVDTLPANVIVATPNGLIGACPGAASAPAGGSSITYPSGALVPPGGCTIQVDVTSSTPGTHTNTVAGGSLQTDLGANPAPASATLTVLGAADLSVTKSDSPDPVLVGANLTYTLAVTNLGPSPASNVSVSDTLPAGVTFVSASGTGWACAEAGGVVTCTRAALAVGAAPDITVVVTVTASAVSPITNAVSSPPTQVTLCRATTATLERRRLRRWRISRHQVGQPGSRPRRRHLDLHACRHQPGPIGRRQRSPSPTTSPPASPSSPPPAPAGRAPRPAVSSPAPAPPWPSAQRPTSPSSLPSPPRRHPHQQAAVAADTSDPVPGNNSTPAPTSRRSPICR